MSDSTDRKVGRPTKFSEDMIETARKLAIIGATDLEIADILGIDVGTLYRWRNTKEEFCKALKTGKEESDERVKRRLYDRALGYTTTEQNIVKIRNEAGQEEIRIVTIDKHYPPDPTSMIFWLKNRQPNEWRDKQSTEHLGADGQPVDLPTRIEIVSPTSANVMQIEEMEEENG